MSELEDLMATHIRLAQLPEPKREFRAVLTRKFRWDFAWPSFRLLIEIQGGTWRKGAHSSGTGIQRDIEKLNIATLEGWQTLQFTGDDVRTGRALKALRIFFDSSALPGDIHLIREAIQWNLEECQLGLCLDALDRVEKSLARVA